MRFLFTLKEISKKISDDNISGYASQSCFFITLSFFPFIMLLLTLIRFLPVKYGTIISILDIMTPVQMHSFIASSVTEIFEKASLTLTSVTAVAAIWAAGKGFMSLMQGFNRIYNIKESRNFIMQRLIACFYTLAFVLIIMSSLIILVFGNTLLLFVENKFPNTTIAVDAIISVKDFIFPCILVIFFLFIYMFIPSRKSKVVNELPGAVIAATGWFLFSYFYSLYVSIAPSFSNMYGSLTTLVFALVWLYFCIQILFLGAEFNAMMNAEIIHPRIFRRQK